MVNDSVKGQPYQIFSEVENVGKTLCPRGRCDGDLAGVRKITITRLMLLMHSIVSGKKVLYYDNTEVTSTTAVLVSEFSYGWVQGINTYRVEARIIQGEFVYQFSIDGSAFNNWPRDRPPRQNKKNNSLPAERRHTRRESLQKGRTLLSLLTHAYPMMMIVLASLYLGLQGHTHQIKSEISVTTLFSTMPHCVVQPSVGLSRRDEERSFPIRPICIRAHE